MAADEELRVGDYNDLEVVRFVDFGLYLESIDFDILLPLAKIPPGTKLGDVLHVFIYKDSENRLIATTDTPMVTVDHCEILEVMDVNKYGAFVDWGIDNQLLVPFGEQVEPLEPGDKVLVYLFHDHVSDRLVGSTRLDKYLHNEHIGFAEKDKVDLIVFQETEIGYKAVINRKHIGLLYASELDRDLVNGEELKGYIKKIREDGKVDLTLKQPGFNRILSIPEMILNELKNHNGFLPLNDKSPPEEIKKVLNISKSDFKKAVGMLYKKRTIEIKDNGIRLHSLE
jgi:hypothetical protein